jgi:hypothetical protein
MVKVFKESHEKDVERLTDDMTEKMKLILKVRTQMVESIYKYFDLGLSESQRFCQVVYLHTTGPMVQEVQLLVNTQVRQQFTIVQRVYVVV